MICELSDEIRLNSVELCSISVLCRSFPRSLGKEQCIAFLGSRKIHLTNCFTVKNKSHASIATQRSLSTIIREYMFDNRGLAQRMHASKEVMTYALHKAAKPAPARTKQGSATPPKPRCTPKMRVTIFCIQNFKKVIFYPFQPALLFHIVR